jgi:hypothetical protein
MLGIVPREPFVEALAGATQMAPLKASEVDPCSRQVLDQKTFGTSFETLVEVRTAQEYTGEAVDSLAGETAVVGHPCKPFGGTCTGLASALLGDRKVVVGGSRKPAVSLLDIPRNCHLLEKSH